MAALVDMTADDCFRMLVELDSRYQYQLSNGWIPVLVPNNNLPEAVNFLENNFIRYNPEDDHRYSGSNKGIWNHPIRGLFLIKDLRVAFRFKLIYG